MSTDYYLLGTAILLFIAAVWSPSTRETKAEKYKRLEEICIHGRETISVSLSTPMADRPTP
jgi:hypothetical protein